MIFPSVAKSKMEIDALIVFAKVVEAGSFSAAGRRMGMPVSTVSRRLAELEDRLGTRLLERSTRQIRLTEVGAEILEHARRGLEIEETVSAIASNRSAAARGTLRISVPPSLSENLFVPLVIEFQNAHPEVDVRMFVADRHVDLISEGFDLAFRTGPLKDSGMTARPVLRYRHLLLASRAFMATIGPPEKPVDLLHHPLCAFSVWPNEATWSFEKASKRQAISFKPHLALNDYSGLAIALAAGAGIGEMPSIVPSTRRTQSELVEIMPGWQFPVEELFMLHASSRHPTLTLSLFRDHVVHRLSGLLEVDTEHHS